MYFFKKEIVKICHVFHNIRVVPVWRRKRDFREIFAETIKVNTLDQNKYREIQQHLIDALDKAEYVRVVGKGDNKTYIIVAMNDLENPECETNFENCLADVNIPLGEVFTSPKLKGTSGKLHVTSVYLNGLKFENLEIDFEDGCIKDYKCTNFDDEKDEEKDINDLIDFCKKNFDKVALIISGTGKFMRKKRNFFRFFFDFYDSKYELYSIYGQL